MRFLLDENLSPLIGAHLVAAGHEAVHVRELELKSSPDDEIIDYAQREGLVLVSRTLISPICSFIARLTVRR